MFINFIGFFGVYCNARKYADDKLWKSLMFPWIVLTAIASTTNLVVMILLPWSKRIAQDFPTRCSYIACHIAAYYEALGQLCISGPCSKSS